MSWLHATTELLEVARTVLREQIMPALDGGGRYEAAMVANAMAVAIREIEQGDAARAEERALLAEFYGATTETLPELRRRLCRDLRDGTVVAERSDALHDLLRRIVHARLAISNPDYADSKR
jgi:hypothetical protein